MCFSHSFRYLYSVPTPDDAAIAATLSPQDLQTSNVENFFGSDDSSEGMLILSSNPNTSDDYGVHFMFLFFLFHHHYTGPIGSKHS